MEPPPTPVHTTACPEDSHPPEDFQLKPEPDCEIQPKLVEALPREDHVQPVEVLPVSPVDAAAATTSAAVGLEVEPAVVPVATTNAAVGLEVEPADIPVATANAAVGLEVEPVERVEKWPAR